MLDFANSRIVLLQLGWSTIKFYYYIWLIDYLFLDGSGEHIYFSLGFGDFSDFKNFLVVESVYKKSSMRYAYWVVGFFVIAGNTWVIVSTFVRTSCFKKTWPSTLLHCNHIVILNIAIADFMMGIYLITISIMHVMKQPEIFFRGIGCYYLQWFATVSSEASCFLMVTLTAFRLYHVYRPLSSMTASSWLWKSCIFISWFAAVLLAIFYSDANNRYVNYEDYVFDLAKFGICLPNFYNISWISLGWTSFTLITLNLTCFCFIAVGYVLIYIRSTKRRPINAENRRTVGLQKQEAEMQKRIARIIITDCACWVPICIMGYAITGGWRPNPFIMYEVTAGFLLPINSALNPVLFSVNLGKLFKKFRCRPIERCRN